MPAFILISIPVSYSLFLPFPPTVWRAAYYYSAAPWASRSAAPTVAHAEAACPACRTRLAASGDRLASVRRARIRGFPRQRTSLGGALRFDRRALPRADALAVSHCAFARVREEPRSSPSD